MVIEDGWHDEAFGERHCCPGQDQELAASGMQRRTPSKGQGTWARERKMGPGRPSLMHVGVRWFCGEYWDRAWDKQMRSDEHDGRQA